MVFLTSGSNSESPKPRNLLILEKLRQARVEQEAQIKKKEISPQEIPSTSKKFAHQRETVSSSSSQSIDKLQLIRRSTVQEKLFAAQCQRSRQNFANYRRPSRELESSSNSINRMRKPRPQGNSKNHQKYNGRRHGDDDDDDDDDDNCYKYNKGNNANYNNDKGNVSDNECHKTGVLHLKKPLQLVESDELNYYNGHGRNEPIDWSLVKGETNERKKNTYVKKIDKNVSTSKEIKQTPDGLPIGNTEFINFVNNSTTNDTVYTVHSNLKNTIKHSTESPILKIQKAINKSKVDKVKVAQEIRESFEPKPQDRKIMDFIDAIIKRSQSFQNKTPQTYKPYDNKNYDNSRIQKNQKTNIENFKRSQLKQVNSESINISNNSNHTAGRKNIKDEYNDDMIGFVKPNKQSTSSLIISDNTDKKFDSDENSDPAHVHRKLIEKFKKSRISRIHSSPDSDDVSTERSSELDDLSATRGSTISKYESLKKRLLDVSTQTSPKNRSIDNIKRNLLLRNIEKVKMNESEEEPLIKESSTRYLRNLNITVDETVMEKEKSDTEELLLKPVSTRYFSSSEKEKMSNESVHKLITKENIIKVTKIESISNELNGSNKNLNAKDDNDEIGEMISGTEEVKKLYKDNCFNESENGKIIEKNIIKTTGNESVSNELNVSNEESWTEKDNNKTKEIILVPKIKEIASGPKIEEIDSISKIEKIEEIVLSPKVEEIEQITSSPKIEEIEEIYRDDCSTPLSEVFSLTEIDYKIKNNVNCDSTTSSSLEKKDSEKNSIIINRCEMQINLSMPNCKAQQLSDYEDINSDEEFDIVNCDQFSAFGNLVAKLKQVASAQKDHALNLQKEFYNYNYTSDTNLDTNELNNESQNNLKAIESSFEISDNNFSSISASVSSNLESDNEMSTNSSCSSNFLLPNKNIFENIEINVEELNNYPFNNDQTSTEATKATEANNEKKEVNGKTELSARQQKKANALRNYCKTKVTEEKNEVDQKNDDAVQNESLSSKECNKGNQILEKIKKRKLHLNCKTWVGNNLNC